MGGLIALSVVLYSPFFWGVGGREEGGLGWNCRGDSVQGDAGLGMRLAGGGAANSAVASYLLQLTPKQSKCLLTDLVLLLLSSLRCCQRCIKLRIVSLVW